MQTHTKSDEHGRGIAACAYVHLPHRRAALRRSFDSAMFVAARLSRRSVEQARLSHPFFCHSKRGPWGKASARGTATAPSMPLPKRLPPPRAAAVVVPTIPSRMHASHRRARTLPSKIRMLLLCGIASLAPDILSLYRTMGASRLVWWQTRLPQMVILVLRHRLPRAAGSNEARACRELPSGARRRRVSTIRRAHQNQSHGHKKLKAPQTFLKQTHPTHW